MTHDTKASSERVRAWLVSGCAGEPPLIDIATMRELVEMMLAAPPPSAAPGAAHVATVLPGNGFLAEVPNGLPPGTRLYTAAPVGRAGQVQEPLSAERISDLARDAQIAFCLKSGGCFEEEFARAIERACAEKWGVQLTKEGGNV